MIHSISPRRKIPTHVKLLVCLNALPKQYHQQLHASQLSRYKNHFKVNDYFAHELIKISDQSVQTLQQLNTHAFDRNCAMALLRLTATVRNAFKLTKHFYKTLHACKDTVVDTVQRIQSIISIKASAKLLGLSCSTLRSWITQVRIRCNDSVIHACRKVHPNQLLASECNTIKQLLLNDEFTHWPLVSLYYYALHKKLVSISLSTWYKYVAIFNIKRYKPISIKKHQPSVQASFPNQYWHADVTQFKTNNGVLHYIYLVVDNYSKMILAWQVSTKLSAAVRLQTFKQAIEQTLYYHPQHTTTNLIVDGGRENNNNTVEQFLQSLTQLNIRKLKALKDVPFSNAHAEAANRTLKLYYLNREPIADTQALQNILANSINELNTIRPNSRIQGLKPIEAYTFHTIDKTQISQQIQTARVLRASLNKINTCGSCKY